MLSKNIDITNKTVIITGAAGFIGANLILKLLKISVMLELLVWTTLMIIMMFISKNIGWQKFLK